MQDREQSIALQNRALRRQLLKLHITTDRLFAALSGSASTATEAEEAMGELWGSGKFDCGPQDYSYMVMRCLEAIRASRTNPITPCHE